MFCFLLYPLILFEGGVSYNVIIDFLEIEA